MTRAELDRMLQSEHGEPLTRLGWWQEAEDALDNPDVLLIVLWLMRQAGKTTFLAREAVHTLLTVPNSYVLFLSASEGQAMSLFHRKLRRPIERMLKALGVSRKAVSLTRRSLELLDLGAKVEVLPTSEITSPGRSVSLLVVDEARDVPDSVYATLLPSIIASNGKVLIASTAGRPSGFFHSLVTSPQPESRIVTAAGNDNPRADAARIGLVSRLLALVSPAYQAREMRNEFAEDEAVTLLPAPLVAAAVDDALGELPHSDLPAFAFLDLSRKKDLTSLVVVLRDAARRPEAADHLVVASVLVLNPKDSPTGEIDFAEVRQALARLPLRFPRLERLLVDEGAEAGSVLPFARSHPALSLRVEGFTASADSNMTLWGALAARFHGRTVSIPRHPRLLDELRNLRQEAFAFGAKWRVIDASRKYHRDISVALAGACYAAGEMGIEAADVSGPSPADQAARERTIRERLDSLPLMGGSSLGQRELGARGPLHSDQRPSRTRFSGRFDADRGMWR